MPKSYYPKISIITPTLNQGNYIEQTIDSVLAQNYPNLEYIIIDGGSTDNTVNIIKKHQKHLSFWISESDKGQSNAINKGLKYLTGDIFNWINSDDFYEPNAFKTISNEFLLDPNLDILCGKERVIRNGIESEIKAGSTLRKQLKDSILKAHIDQPPTFWRLDRVKYLGGLSENYHYLMDSELWVKYLLQFGQSKIKFVDEIFTNFRIHSNSKTAQFQNRFDMERLQLVLAIAETVDTPSEILLEYSKIFNCPPNSPLNIKKLNSIKIKKELLLYFIEKFFGLFYFDHNFIACRKIVAKTIFRGVYKFNTSFLKLLIGLYIFPDCLLRKIIKQQRFSINPKEILEY